MHLDVVMMSVLMRLVSMVCCALSVKCLHSELKSWSPDDYSTLHSMLQTSNGLRLVITGQTDVYKVDAVNFQLLSKLNQSGISNMIHNRTATVDYVTVCSNQSESCLIVDPLDNCKGNLRELKPPIKIDGVSAIMITNTRGAEGNQYEDFLFVGCPHVEGQEKLGGRCTEPGISWYLNSGKIKSDPWYGFKSYNDTPVLTDKYIDAFSVDTYSVFFSLQRVVATGTKRSRIAQVCLYIDQKDGNDSTPYTYADMPIQCGQLKEIRAVKKVVFKTKTVFVAVFSESSKSAVCVFTMEDIEKMFAENIKDCYRGIRVPENEDYADFQNSDVPCSRKIADNDTFREPNHFFLCNTDNLPLYRQVIGNKTLSSQPVVDYDDAEITAVAVSVLESTLIATLGTAKGDILEAVIYPSSSAVKIKQPRIHNFGRDILHDMHTSPDNKHVFVLTRKQVFKLPVHQCSSYSTCHYCTQGGYCEWCAGIGSCRYRGFCQREFDVLGIQCGKVNISSAEVSTRDIQQVRITFPVPFPVSMFLRFDCLITLISDDRMSSTTTVRTSLIDTPDSKWKIYDRSIQEIEKRTKGTMNATFVCEDFYGQFLIYKCKTITRLSLCTKSNWKCKWCQYNSQSHCIDSDKSCNTSGVEVKAGECPRVTNYTLISDDSRVPDHNGTVYISRDRDYEIDIAGLNLKDAGLVTYKCKLMSDTQTLWFNSTQFDEGGGITCKIYKDEMFTISRHVDRLKAALQVVWGDSPLGDTLPIIIYACENLVQPSHNCEQCKSLASYQPYLHCQWNGTRCIDSTITLETTECGDPEITKVYQLNTYSNDTTTVLIEGVNLDSAYIDTVNGVTVAGEQCIPIEPGPKIWCELSPRSSVINGSMVITLKNNSKVWIPDPDRLLIPMVTSIKPTSGPMSGGTSVSLHGKHLDIGRNATVTIGDNTCILTKTVAPNSLICKTLGLNSYKTTAVTSEAVIKIDGAEVLGKLKYTYLEDPFIKVIHPKTSFASGGTIVTVVGSHLHAIKTPKLYSTVTVVASAVGTSTRTYISELQNCTKPNDDSVDLHCPTPRYPGEGVITRGGVFTRLGFEMDDVPSVSDYNLPSNVAYLRYFPDPKLKHVNVVKSSGTMRHLVIEGDGLDLAADKSDVKVLIDCESYDVTDVSSGKIEFDLPVDRPVCSNRTELTLNISVQIGYFSQIIGSVTFESKGSDLNETTMAISDTTSQQKVTTAVPDRISQLDDSGSMKTVVIIALVVLVVAIILSTGIGSLYFFRKYRAMRNQTRNTVEFRTFQNEELDERRVIRTTSTVSYAYARDTSGEYDYIRDADVVNTYLELSGEDPTYTKADEYVDPHPYRKLDSAVDQSEIKNDIPVNDDSENKKEKNIQSEVMGTQDGVNELGCDLNGGNMDAAYTPRNEKETSDESMSSANNDGNIEECPTNIDGGYIHAVWTQEFDTGKREDKLENSNMDSPLETVAANFKGAAVETTPKGIAPGQDDGNIDECLTNIDGGYIHAVWTQEFDTGKREDMFIEQKDLVENEEFAQGTCQENIITTCGQDIETEEHGGKLEEKTAEEIIPTRDCK
ncbi:plexin A3-like [Mercenaria mercenaria]|uniref:plexin A3-like n=1 Tax=Mercenaria mercenaria TaxID=6596 RepID=UPI00234E4683|nr:plexin A3-like [Mercenaria mercenaria]